MVLFVTSAKTPSLQRPIPPAVLHPFATDVVYLNIGPERTAMLPGQICIQVFH